MTGLPTGTVTFLFTDIEGSTRLLQQLGDRYAEVLAAHHRLLRTAIQEAQGQLVDTQGDAVFAAFPRARDALLAAIAAERAMLAHPWPSVPIWWKRLQLCSLRRDSTFVRRGYSGQLKPTAKPKGILCHSPIAPTTIVPSRSYVLD
jgi:Adenylate and Guanylate cyclase catalytic domain